LFCKEMMTVPTHHRPSWWGMRTEKEIKGWMRIKKTRLIDCRNPTWEDLSSSFFS